MATCECRRSSISRRFSKRRPLQRRMPRWSQRDLRWRPPGKTQRPRRSAHRLKPSTGRLVPSGSSAKANHSTLHRGTICELEWIGSTPVRSEPAEEARHRRVVPMRRCSAVLTETTTIPDFRGFSSFQSPLTDSNRRPPPYHRATRREPRARAGSRGHGSPARRRNRPKTSDLPWTPVLALVFPRCSLGKPAGAHRHAQPHAQTRAVRSSSSSVAAAAASRAAASRSGGSSASSRSSAGRAAKAYDGGSCS
jgi:hypothetical protein